MLTRGYLCLHLKRIKKPEEWPTDADGLSFILAKGGTGRFISPAVTQSFGPGDVLLTSGSFGGRVVADGPEILFWAFSIQFDHLYPLFANDEIHLVQGLKERLKGFRRYPAATDAAAECHRLIAGAPPQFSLDHRTHLLRIAAAVISSELSQLRPDECGFVSVEDHLKLVFERLSFDEILSLSVDELAQRFSCSRRHLNRLFHQHFGLSVASLRMEMRLLKAASLLRDPNVKVINVAELCGFNHLGLFNTCFRRRFGMSPGQWRTRAGEVGCEPKADRKCPLHMNGLCPWTLQSTDQDLSVPGLNGRGAGRLERSRGEPKPEKRPISLRFGLRA